MIPTTNQDILAREQLNKNLLHFYPINTRLMKAACHASIGLNKYLTNLNWNGHLVNVLSSTVYVSGSVVATPCAVIEHVAAATLYFLGYCLNQATNRQNIIVKKYTAMCFAYAGESLLQIVMTALRLVIRKFPKYHTEVTLFYHGIHLFTAGVGNLARLDLGVTAKSKSERENYFVERIPLFIPLAIEWLQGALNEIMRSYALDLETSENSVTLTQTGLSQTSQDILVRELSNLNPRQLTDSNYRNTLLQNLQPVIQEILRLSGAHEIHGITVFGPQGNEAKYQEYLMACSIEALKRVYNNDQLVAYLPGGRDAILGFYPEATCLLSHMTQLIEIEKFPEANTPKCPEIFSGGLEKYNSRYSRIKNLSEKLQILTPQEKEYLQQMIMCPTEEQQQKIKPAVLMHEPEIKALITGIGELGGAIHQGNLMGVLRLEASAEPIQAVNLFVGAWREAVIELTRSANQ